MGRFDGVLLVSDICDTLIDTSDGAFVGGDTGELKPVSEQDRRALEYFTAEGGRFTVATGRGLKYILPYGDSIPINAPVVLGDGAAIYDIKSGAYLELAALDERARELGQTLLDRSPTTSATTRHLDGGFCAVRPDSDIRMLMKLDPEILEVSSLLEVPIPMQSLRFSDQHETLKEIHDFLRTQDTDGAYELTFTAEKRLQMTARGYGKGNMVRRLAERLDISMEHVYCAGNGEDDISMLKVAKQGFIPYNCSQEVQDCGASEAGSAGQGLMKNIIARLENRY